MSTGEETLWDLMKKAETEARNLRRSIFLSVKASAGRRKRI
jgi:hypothetical protein